jgi:hypothetical protein
LHWHKKQALIEAEARRDGFYLLYTSPAPAHGDKGQVLGHYKNLLAVEAAFGQLTSHLEVRPVHHFRPDRVRNHVRLCFLAYWLCARPNSMGCWRGWGCCICLASRPRGPKRSPKNGGGRGLLEGNLLNEPGSQASRKVRVARLGRGAGKLGFYKKDIRCNLLMVLCVCRWLP